MEKILREVDPYDLIAEGAPDDEYDFEAKYILEILNNSNSNVEIREKIYNHFFKTFGSMTLSNSNLKKLVDVIIEKKDEKSF